MKSLYKDKKTILGQDCIYEEVYINGGSRYFIHVDYKGEIMRVRQNCLIDIKLKETDMVNDGYPVYKMTSFADECYLRICTRSRDNEGRTLFGDQF